MRSTTPLKDGTLSEVETDEAGDSLVGKRVGGYRATRMLGRGGAGEVYLAEHPVVQSKVAVKVLRPDIARSNTLVRRFVREAQAANRVNSPHIVPVTDFGKLPDGRPYAVMEYLSGESLDEMISLHAPMPLGRTAPLIAQIADAMAAAHDAGIVHRDLKPANIFVEAHEGGGEFVRILDFGIAKFAEVPGKEPTLTGHAGLLGTPRYAAPEQLAGGETGPACDVYALGTMAWEMLAGQTPFDGRPTELIAQKNLEDPPDLSELRPELPADICRFIQRMVARLPEDRPTSMGKIRDFFASATEWSGVHSKGVPPGLTEELRSQSTWQTRALIGGIVLVVGALAWWMLQEPPPETASAPRTPIVSVQKPPSSPVPTPAPPAVAEPPPKAQAPVEPAPLKVEPAKPTRQTARRRTLKRKPKRKPKPPKSDGLLNPLLED